MEARPLDSAIAYAELGWQVFPTHSIGRRPDSCCSCGDADCRSPGKHPRTPNGVKDATDIEEVVRAWWLRWPDANVGIAMGSSTGLWALDIDMRLDRATGEILKDGEASYVELCAGRLIMPTLESRTGGGGRHLFFAWDDDVPVGCPGTGRLGLDVKGEGGYVLVAPSNHVSGSYEWENGPDVAVAQPPPPWLLHAVLNPPIPAGRQSELVASGGRMQGPPPDDKKAISIGQVSQPAPLQAIAADDELREALATIPPNIGYDGWLAIAMGLHDETGGSEEGFALFLEWSARAAGMLTPSGNPAFVGEGDCRAKWASFKISAGNVRGRRTIFDIAIHQHGYKSRLERPASIEPAEPGAAPRAPGLEPEWPWDRSLPPVFPLDMAFPPALAWLRDFFSRLAWTYQVPVDLPVLLGAPIAMAALAGKMTIKVPGERWSEPAVLWTICAMSSGGGKSPVHRDLVRPVREWERRLDNSRAVAEHTSRIMIAEAEVKRAMTKLHKRSAQIDDDQRRVVEADLVTANEHLAMAKASTVQSEEIIAAEATTERLVELLQRSYGRVLVSDAEGDIFDVAMGRYSNSTPNLGPWLKGYDGDTIKQERVGGDRIVHRPLINVGVATQIEALAFLTDKVARGRGFVARFAAASIAPSRGRLFMPGRDMPESEFAQWNQRITELLDRMRPLEPDELVLSPDAAAAFSAWGQGLFDRMDQLEADEGEDPRDAWFRKYPGKVLRVALLLHGLQEDSLRRLVVDLPTMEAALAWGSYLAAHNDAMATELRTDPELRTVERVLGWLDRKGLGGEVFTRRELLRGLSGPRSAVRVAGDLTSPLATLVETGWISGVGGPSQRAGARPAVWRAYRAVSGLAAYLARHRAAELERAQARAAGEDGRPARW